MKDPKDLITPNFRWYDRLLKQQVNLMPSENNDEAKPRYDEAAYQREYRRRMRAQGFLKVEVWAPKERAEDLRALAENWRANALRKTS